MLRTAGQVFSVENVIYQEFYFKTSLYVFVSV